MAATDHASNRTRCRSCGRGLPFEAWTRGLDRCAACAGPRAVRQRAATAAYAPPPAPGAGSFRSHRDYERMLDEVPQELVDELARAVEDEARARSINPAGDGADSLFRGFIEEVGFGESRREISYALWGFAIGFVINVALMKYVQMAAAAPMSAVLGPMLIGGVVAGATCAAIGWGLARLRER